MLRSRLLRTLLSRTWPRSWAFLLSNCGQAKRLLVLDVGLSHLNQSTGELIRCPMRLVQHPGGYWYCIDCGMAILYTALDIEVNEKTTDSDTARP